MNNENNDIAAEVDSAKSCANTLLAYVERAVIAEMFGHKTETRDMERSEK